MRIIPWWSHWFASCLLSAGLAVGFSTQAAIPASQLPAAGTAIPDQAFEKVDAFLQERIDAMGLPGAAIAVSSAGFDRDGAIAMISSWTAMTAASGAKRRAQRSTPRRTFRNTSPMSATRT